MQRKKQSATLSQLALHFAVFTPNCIKLRSICHKNHGFCRGFSLFSELSEVKWNISKLI